MLSLGAIEGYGKMEGKTIPVIFSYCLVTLLIGIDMAQHKLLESILILGLPWLHQ